jgi:SLT domain-containing protein
VAGVQKFERSLNSANKAVDRNNAALRSQGKAAADAQRGFLPLVGAVSGFGDASTVASSKSSMFAKALGAVNLATGVLEPALAGVIVAAGALAGAFAAGAAGAAAYGIALKPLFTETSDALKAQEKAQAAVTAANQQYQAAIASGANKKTAEAARTRAIALAHQQLAGVMKTLPAPVARFATQVKRTQDGYKAWANSLSRPVLRPLTEGLRLVHPILHAISPLVRAAARAIRQLVGEFGLLVLSPRFEQQIRVLLPHVRPTILNLAHAFGNVAAGIWGVIKAFLPMSDTITGGVTKLTAKFKAWGQSLPSHTGFQSLMTMFKTQTPLAVGVLKNLAVIIANVARATVGLASPANSKALLQILTPLTQIVAKLSQNQALVRFVIYMLLLNSALKKVGLGFTAAAAGLSGFIGAGRGIANLARGFSSAESAASAATGTMGTLGGKLSTVYSFLRSLVSALAATTVAWVQNTAAMVVQKTVSIAVAAATKVMTAAQWLLNVALDANPIGLIVIALAALGAAFYLAWTKSATFRKILIAAWKAIWDVIKTVWNWIKGHWPLLLAILTGPIGAAVILIIRHWRQITAATKTLWHDLTAIWNAIWRNTIGRVQAGVRDVERWYNSLPDGVRKALWGLGHMLYGIATGSLREFLAGFRSVAGSILGWLRGFVGSIIRLIGRLIGRGSPAREFFNIGRDMMLGLEKGIKAHAHKARDAAMTSVGNINWKPGAGVAQWGPLVRRALLMEGLNPLLAARVMYQMQTESGGNPNAINLTDINAQRGDPSRGLLQTIGATFRAYHWPGTSWNIYNPLANIAAAINYARHRYGPTLMSGGMGMGSGHGYAAGTVSAAPGWAWVGERGPELMRFKGGEQVRRAGSVPTHVTYNISVQVPVAANKAVIGREVVQAIKEYEKSSGTRWRR